MLALALVGAGAYWWIKPVGLSSKVSITVLSKQGVAVEPNALSAKLIPADDLPPGGTRSLFDHLIAQNDGLPYPFEKLIALLQKLDPQNRPPPVLMIPQGRSLLKALADYEHPRSLLAMDFQAPNAASLGLAPRGQVFLGFVENAHEIEVLSYNEGAGRFEFQLVQNYCEGCVPRLVYAKRAVCLSCHQGGGPIFPQRPWNETNGQPETAARIAEARAAAGLDPARYLTAPTANLLSVPERFDELTDIGNFIPTLQRIWLDGCGGAAGVSESRLSGAKDGKTDADGVSCRAQMLKLALRYLLSPGQFDAGSAESLRLIELQTQAWPAAGIAVAGNDLFPRDPLSERRSLRGRLRQLLVPKPQPGAGAKNNEDLAAFDKLPRLPVDLDPLTPRAPKRVLTARDVDGVYGIAALFTDADFSRLEKASGYQADRLVAAVDRIDPGFFKPAPYSRVKAMQALLVALGDTTAPGYCCLDTSEMSPTVASGEPPVAIGEDSMLKHFEAYCFACHRGNPSKRLNFMSGRSEDEVLALIRQKSEIRDALDWPRYTGTDKENKLMPPEDSVQRQKLQQALVQNPKLLEQMQAVVPGLFDF